MSVWNWSQLLPFVAPEFRISLGEGNTPLVRSRSIGPQNGLENLFFKVESANPTGSYKDRFAALAISQMLAEGKTRCLATSSGNTGAALAAYCAAARLECEIAVVETAPDNKLRQMQVYGAQIYRVRGFGLDADVTMRVMKSLRARGQRAENALQISAYAFSPFGMAGVQSIAYELAEESREFGGFDHIFVPAGGGGLTLALARGFGALIRARLIERGPRVECVQPVGNDTIATPLREGRERGRNVVCASQISGLQVASVLDGDEVIAACRASGGNGHTVEDEEVWATQQMLARQEGLWCEPAGAVALAAALKARRNGEIAPDAPVACLVTGSGSKDEAALTRMVADSPCPTVGVEQFTR